jgi:Protein of unknown function (DUF3455)
MKDRNPKDHGRILAVASIAALGLAFALALPHAAYADDIAAPIVPDKLQVLAPNQVFLVGHAVGTQNYVCVSSAAGVDWSLFTPQATLFNDSAQQVITHFFSPNPRENGVVRAAWESAKDSSTVWASVTAVATSATDPLFVRADAIPWLTAKEAGVQAGPTGGDKLTRTTFVQRVHTAGGVAPATGCTQFTDIGNRAFVPYSADYFFYYDPTVR